MVNRIERAETFGRLHVKGDPVVPFNIRDAGTARVVAGAKAIAPAHESMLGVHRVASLLQQAVMTKPVTYGKIVEVPKKPEN